MNGLKGRRKILKDYRRTQVLAKDLFFVFSRSCFALDDVGNWTTVIDYEITMIDNRKLSNSVKRALFALTKG